MKNIFNAMWLLLMLTAASQLLDSTVDAQVPSSPCPAIFQYIQGNNNVWRGKIFVIPPDGSLQITLRVHLFLTSPLSNGYVGRLLLVNNSFEAAQKILEGKKDPLEYELLFPLRNPLPSVDRIIVNDKTVCQGQAVSSTILTTIFLEYKFTAMTNPEGNFFKPSNTPVHHTVPTIPSTSPTKQTTFPPWLTAKTQISSFPTEVPHTASEKDPGPETILFPESHNQFPLPTPHPSLDQEECGRVIMANELILNGKQTSSREWPWIAAIFYNSTSDDLLFHCGATLISNRHVITAAHCVKLIDEDNIYSEINPSLLVVYVGLSSFKQKKEAYSQARKVERIFIHPDFQVKSNYDADVAILKVAFPVQYSQNVQRVCLWPFSPDLNKVVGKLGTVVGWGMDETGHKTSDVPRRTEMPIVSEKECLRSNPGFPYITSERTFCAGFRNDSGPCSGDIGSGLLLKISDGEVSRWYLRGITSVSLYDTKENRCDLHNYIVFTDVAKFSDWIRGCITEKII